MTLKITRFGILHLDLSTFTFFLIYILAPNYLTIYVTVLILYSPFPSVNIFDHSILHKVFTRLCINATISGDNSKIHPLYLRGRTIYN